MAEILSADPEAKRLLDTALDKLGEIVAAEFADLQQQIQQHWEPSADPMTTTLFYRIREFLVVAVQLCNRSIRGGEFEAMTVDDIKPVWDSKKFKRTKSNSMAV